MANNLSKNPWVLDQAPTSPVVAAGTTLKPRKVVWTGEAIADGDALLITDAAGAVVLDWHALADDTGIAGFDFPPNYSCDGLILSAMGHGTLYIYF